MATSFSSFPYANTICCMLNRLLLAGDAWGVPGEGDLPFLGLAENGAVPLVGNMAKNTQKKRKFCKEGVRTSSETLKNEFPNLKIRGGGSPHNTPISGPHTASGRFWGGLAPPGACHMGTNAPSARTCVVAVCFLAVPVVIAAKAWVVLVLHQLSSDWCYKVFFHGEPDGRLRCALRRALRRAVWVIYRRNSAAYIHTFVTYCSPPPPTPLFSPI